mgnify:FL=1|jgi:hypothetical protein
MKNKLFEASKDIGFGIALVAGIAATFAGLIYFMELVNMTKDSIRLMIATPLFLYFCWAFGGLTRDILKRN